MEILELSAAYRVARDHAVAIDVTGRGLIRLDGDQRVWFLQNTVTADLDAVEQGRWTWSCFLDPKGKVLAHFRTAVDEEQVWLDVDPPATDELASWFTRYRFRTRVEVEDRTGACFALVGPGAPHPAPGHVTSSSGGVAFGDEVGGLPVTILHTGTAPDLPRAPVELWEVLRVEAGLPRFAVDYGPDTLPQEAGLTSELSVTKGCYVGQEVVARLHFRGHVNRVVRPLELDAVVEPGRSLLHDGQRVGRISSVVVSPDRGPIGMGMVRVEVPQGSRVEVEGGGTAVVGPVPHGTKTQRTVPPART
ncbi:MAG TPA: glycine cleavage T C-terminal barrel domain-containing protein [Actinomycetota bacterium]|nr:glycine cleavage T C-terminal barrel domain-containing protein [Actinomycetota bacterium]